MKKTDLDKHEGLKINSTMKTVRRLRVGELLNKALGNF